MHTKQEMAPLAEIMGCNEWAPEVFNCNAPDSGSMALLAAYGNEEQKARWLQPLLAGEIRSCFAMTEPSVASSDATNIATRARHEGDQWVINGEKWWISGPVNPACRLAIVMCRSDPDADRTRQHSMILVPLDAPGVELKRHLTVLGYDFAPRGHYALRFENVRVPASNALLGPGRGFEIAQGRLGPGRIHGCFVAHLEQLVICTSGLDDSRVAALNRSLLDGYREAGGQFAERELAGWTAFSLFCLSREPFRDRLPDWPKRVRETLARTRTLLASAGLPG